MRLRLPNFDRPRRIALALGVILLVAGVLLAVFGARAATPVPGVTVAGATAPELHYVRSLPDAGDPDLDRPVGLALDAEYLYVADSGAGVVRRFRISGPDAGEIGRDILRVPADVARDADAGTILVADRELNKVLRFDEDGAPLGAILPSADASATWQPLGIAADGEGAIAVAETSERHQVLIMDRAGQVLHTLGGPLGTSGAGNVAVALDYPSGVVFRGDEWWAGDSNNQRVVVFGVDGELRDIVRVEGVSRGVTFLESADGSAGAGEWYAVLVDALASDIVVLDSEGAVIAHFGGPGSTAGRLAYPNDAVYDPASAQLFIADTGNARVQVWSVVLPGQAEELTPLEIARSLSAAQVAGIVIALLGAIVSAVALWPRRVGVAGAGRTRG